MRVLFVSFWYPPEMGAPAARVSELAQEWAALGHEVTVLTDFPHYPGGGQRPEDRLAVWRYERDGDVRLLRTWVYATPHRGRVRRTLGYLSFLASGAPIGSLLLSRPDVIVATSPQIFAGVLGVALARRFRAPLVLEIRDLWPESIVTAGAMGRGVAFRAVKGLAQWLYDAADHIVTVGEGYSRGILRGYRVSPDKLRVFTNGVDPRRFRPRDERRAAVRAAHGWGDETVAMYLGSHGLCHRLSTVLDAADRLRDRQDIRFVLVGDGAEKPDLVREAQRRGLERVSFLPVQGKDEVADLYAAADLCLVPLRDDPLFREVVPSKMFEIMSMERPLVLSVDGDARAIVEQAGAGLCVPPEDAPAIASAITRLHADPALRRALGRSGRRFVQANYDRRAIARAYAGFLSGVASGVSADAHPAGEDADGPEQEPQIAQMAG